MIDLLNEWHREESVRHRNLLDHIAREGAGPMRDILDMAAIEHAKRIEVLDRLIAEELAK